MIKFGPSGTGESFEAEGHKGTFEAAQWLSMRGLNAYEYSFGHGVRLRTETARSIGEEFAKYGIEISGHAPYYINFASENPENIEKSYGYVLSTLKAVKNLGGHRCVFHPGSMGKRDRSICMQEILDHMQELTRRMYEEGYGDMYICAETMGKLNQIGTVDEIIEICRVSERILPCIDFGHVNARTGGSLNDANNMRRLVEHLKEALQEKADIMHVHFSKIQFAAKGEIRHLTFEDTLYGPDFAPLAKLLYENRMSPYVICESSGSQTEDAMTMRDMYNALL